MLCFGLYGWDGGRPTGSKEEGVKSDLDCQPLATFQEPSLNFRHSSDPNKSYPDPTEGVVGLGRAAGRAGSTTPKRLWGLFGQQVGKYESTEGVVWFVCAAGRAQRGHTEGVVGSDWASVMARWAHQSRCEARLGADKPRRADRSS